jgi:hypothetical protein
MWCKSGPKCQIKESNPFISSKIINYALTVCKLVHLCTLYLLWFVLASITKKGEIEREIGLTFSYN